MRAFAITALLLILSGCLSEKPIDPLCKEMEPLVRAHFGEGFEARSGGLASSIIKTGQFCGYYNDEDMVVPEDMVLISFRNSSELEAESREETLESIRESDYYRNATERKIVEKDCYAYSYSDSLRDISSQNLLLRREPSEIGITVMFASEDNYSEEMILGLALDIAQKHGPQGNFLGPSEQIGEYKMIEATTHPSGYWYAWFCRRNEYSTFTDDCVFGFDGSMLVHSDASCRCIEKPYDDSIRRDFIFAYKAECLDYSPPPCTEGQPNLVCKDMLDAIRYYYGGSFELLCSDLSAIGGGEKGSCTYAARAMGNSSDVLLVEYTNSSSMASMTQEERVAAVNNSELIRGSYYSEVNDRASFAYGEAWSETSMNGFLLYRGSGMVQISINGSGARGFRGSKMLDFALNFSSRATNPRWRVELGDTIGRYTFCDKTREPGEHWYRAIMCKDYVVGNETPESCVLLLPGELLRHNDGTCTLIEEVYEQSNGRHFLLVSNQECRNE